jgi:hypothetical protein
MPVQPRPKNPYENIMVLNHIVIKDASQANLTKIAAGGFSTIYLGEIKYWYVYSSDGQ